MGTIYGSNTADSISTDASGNLIYAWAESNLPGDEGPTNDHDTIDGNTGADTVHGGNGRDSIESRGGNDLVYGGAGHDLLFGGAGDDALYGGAGNDAFEDGLGLNAFYGEDGDDRFFSGSSNESLYGGQGIDFAAIYRDDSLVDLVLDLDAEGPIHLADGTVLSDIERTEFTAGRGDDYIAGGSLNDWLVGNDGDDSLLGRGGNDGLIGGNGDNLLAGGAGNDYIVASMFKGTNTVNGGAGIDTLSFVFEKHAASFVFETSAKKTTFDGGLTYSNMEKLYFTGRGDFDDRVTGGSLRDSMNGGGGDDRLFGGGGADFIHGASGHDKLDGARGDDDLFGGRGDDKLFGGVGNDSLYANADSDTLLGGAGADEFYLVRNGGSAVQHIVDFAVARDQIILHRDYFKGVRIEEGGLDAELFVLGKEAKNAQDRFIYNQKTGELYFDRDGTGDKAQVLIAVFQNKAHVRAEDFSVVDFGFLPF
jgi:Ca2+-binding RTX toxin-like protein